MTFSPKLSQVLNKGKIIVAGRVDRGSQVFTSIGLIVTPEMMPSFRFVAFYSIPWVGREEVVPDSIWVDVENSCAGGVSDKLSLRGHYCSYATHQFHSHCEA